MATTYDSINLNRVKRKYQNQRFTIADEHGMQYYSGADCRVYFDDILVSEIDSLGFQQSQNIRPIYGYQSHIFDALQYGTKLVQGYFQVHFTESGYIPTLLAAVEVNRRTSNKGNYYTKISTEEINAGVEPLIAADLLQNATTLEAVLETLGGGDKTTWINTMDALDARRFNNKQTNGKFEEDNLVFSKLKVNGLFPPKPLHNDFAFNPSNTFLRSSGFTITVAYGEGKIPTFVGNTNDTDKKNDFYQTITGSFRQLHECHIVAGPNTQVEADGKPIGELYTFIAKDIS